MFFDHDRQHFFKPLTGKYREVVAQCLRLLYQRLYTDLRDYGHALNRDQLMDIFREAIARAPLLDSEQEEGEPLAEQGSLSIPGERQQGVEPKELEKQGLEQQGVEGRFKSQRELATFILNRLLESGWLERQVDDATLQSTFGFSRAGRLFTQPFVESDSGRVRTRHRNTRNTRNSLQAFCDSGEVHDLLDAYECSERIISDFTDIIAELEERKRQLVREVEARQLVQQASDEFFDFMEKRFQPDVAVRLSADSVEKYRDEITELVRRIRRKRKEWKAEAEFRLRELMPEHVVDGQSLLWNLLDGIDARLRNASEVMLPALRKALHSFTQRADIIIRQLSYLAAHQHNDVLDICKQLVDLPASEQADRLEQAGEQLSSIQPGFVDPGQVRLFAPRQPRVFQNVLDEDDRDFDREARKDLYVQQLLDQAFMVSDSAVRDYVREALTAGESVDTRNLPVQNARDLLAAAHAIEVASSSNYSDTLRFEVTPSGEVASNDYFTQFDTFSIRLVNDE